MPIKPEHLDELLAGYEQPQDPLGRSIFGLAIVPHFAHIQSHPGNGGHCTFTQVWPAI
jgi:hypothetical protein